MKASTFVKHQGWWFYINLVCNEVGVGGFDQLHPVALAIIVNVFQTLEYVGATRTLCTPAICSYYPVNVRQHIYFEVNCCLHVRTATAASSCPIASAISCSSTSPIGSLAGSFITISHSRMALSSFRSPAYMTAGSLPKS